jgi:hypothetical protein
MRPNALVFDYNEFPPVPDSAWEGSEGPHTLALASVLSRDLAAGGFSPGDPVEDEGSAVIAVRGPAGTTDITITFYPRDSDPDFSWALIFSQRKPFLRWLFARPDDEAVVGPVKECVAKVVESQPTRFRNPQWLDESTL